MIDFVEIVRLELMQDKILPSEIKRMVLERASTMRVKPVREGRMNNKEGDNNGRR